MESASEIKRTAVQRQKPTLLKCVELICKTLEHVIRNLQNNGPGVHDRGTQLD